MNLPESGARTPGRPERLAARARPAAPPVMYQQWRDLLFLHWVYPAEVLQATLPEGLFVDRFAGRAYLGIVPFFMRNIRPRGLPAVPGVSNFMEMNLRTYVHDRAGVPGVWFYSLEANQRLAVAVARRFFHLPYHHASMTSTRPVDGGIRYESTRTSPGAKGWACVFEYAAAEEVDPPAPESLEFFLIERYRLYAGSKEGLWRGAVWHPPYPLRRARVPVWNEELTRLNGLAPTGRSPDHIILSGGVDVEVFPLERV